MTDAYPIFLRALTALDVPDPVPEFRFHHPGQGERQRRWRADYYWDHCPALGGPLIVEVEGGAAKGGGHNRIAGFRNDMEKYRQMTIQGIWLLRYMPEQLLTIAVPQLAALWEGADDDNTR